MAFSDKLKEAMQNKEMRAAELSRESGLSEAIISEYLSGKKEPRGKQSVAISKALGVSLDVLWETEFAVPQIEKAPASRQEPLISMEASNSILDGLIKAGIINDGPDLSDEDLAFLTHIVELLDTWFSRKR